MTLCEGDEEENSSNYSHSSAGSGDSARSASQLLGDGGPDEGEWLAFADGALDDPNEL